VEKELPEDEDVVKCKCVCLINMGRFEEAFAVASKAGGILAFEGAYCLYQMNRNQECLAAIVSSSAATSSASTNLKALKAQVLYKLSRASEAADVYQALVDGSGGDGHGECLEGSELLSNTLAAYAAAGRGGEGFSKLSSQVAEFIEEDGGADASAVPEDDEDKSYEIAYNAACALLDAGRYAKAAELLQVAEARCKQQGAFTSTAPTPDGGDGMLSEEGATITCQRAVGLLKACGGSGSGAAQAMALCAGVMKHGKQQQQQQQASLSSASSQQHGSGGDLAVPLALATNTLAVARRDRELFDSHKV
jgi:tetratricopeptide (TPR) repeat protein